MPKLYFSPGACSLSPNIALREAGIPFELERVDLKAKKLSGDSDFYQVNPKGYVPALVLDDGTLLTEGAVMVQYIADLKPESRLAPPAGTLERVRLQEWLHFIATELHKGFGPLYSPIANDEYKESVRKKLAGRFAILAKGVEDKAYLMGEDFSVADAYAFYTMRSWKTHVRAELPPGLEAYFERIAARPAVKAALEAEAART